jgi:hypothetical protein
MIEAAGPRPAYHNCIAWACTPTGWCKAVWTAGGGVTADQPQYPAVTSRCHRRAYFCMCCLGCRPGCRCVLSRCHIRWCPSRVQFGAAGHVHSSSSHVCGSSCICRLFRRRNGCNFEAIVPEPVVVRELAIHTFEPMDDPTVTCRAFRCHGFPVRRHCRILPCGHVLTGDCARGVSATFRHLPARAVSTVLRKADFCSVGK